MEVWQATRPRPPGLSHSPGSVPPPELSGEAGSDHLGVLKAGSGRVERQGDASLGAGLAARPTEPFWRGRARLRVAGFREGAAEAGQQMRAE